MAKLLTIAFLILLFNNLTGQEHKYYYCHKTSDTIKIDGELDELSWQNALWSDCFLDIEGDKKPIPVYTTSVKMLWDDTCFYIAAELAEPHIWATLTKNESVIFHDNDFEVFIDPDGDAHNYLEFEINALGTYWDLLLPKPYRNGGPPLTGFDIHGLQTKVKIHGTMNNPFDTDEKWIVEMAIPFKSISEISDNKVRPDTGSFWRINFSRVQWNTHIVDGKYLKLKNPETLRALPEENWVWSPIGTINMHMPERWGYVVFSEKKPGESISEKWVEPDAEIIDSLWNLYKEEKQFYMKHKKFSSDIIHPENVAICACENLFEITWMVKGKDYFWYINQDGLIKKVKILKH